MVRFRKEQLGMLSEYFAGISKILVASTIVGFFVPTETGPITIPVFIAGSIAAAGFLIFAVKLAPKQ